MKKIKIKEYRFGGGQITTLVSLTKRQARDCISAVDVLSEPVSSKNNNWPHTHEWSLCNKTFKIKFDYPLNDEYYFNIYLGEFASVGELALKIARKYKQIYRYPAKYGIWGHSIKDLALSKITIFDDNSIKLDISS
jgi:hypothetical protein